MYIFFLPLTISLCLDNSIKLSISFLQVERLPLRQVHPHRRETAGHGRPGQRSLILKTSRLKCHNQVALRRQQAQEEAEARQLGVEILKPGDRADLVMGSGGVIRRQQAGEAEAGDNEVGDSDSEKVEMENRDQKQVKVDTTDLPEQGLD